MRRRRAGRRKSGQALSWAATLGIMAGAACALYLLWLPDVTPLKTRNPATTAYIELRKHRAARAKKRFKPRMTWVAFGSISEHLKHAVLTAEDGAFYRHKGVDWENLRVALEKDWKLKRFAYGGSTITQQLARNLYLSPSKNPLRKIKELLIAWRLEKTLGKRRIFELYLNVAEWGDGIYGAQAASQAYFGKHAGELSLDEAVAMAVVLPSPRRHSPARRGRYVERNMARVYRRLRAKGLLPEEGPPPVEDEEPEEIPEESDDEFVAESPSGTPAATAPSEAKPGEGQEWPRP